jgi:hypothetical protein
MSALRGPEGAPPRKAGPLGENGPEGAQNICFANLWAKPNM